jgi:hypothetical protein
MRATARSAGSRWKESGAACSPSSAFGDRSGGVAVARLIEQGSTPSPFAWHPSDQELRARRVECARGPTRRDLKRGHEMAWLPRISIGPTYGTSRRLSSAKVASFVPVSSSSNCSWRCWGMQRCSAPESASAATVTGSRSGFRGLRRVISAFTRPMVATLAHWRSPPRRAQLRRALDRLAVREDVEVDRPEVRSERRPTAPSRWSPERCR